MALMLTAGPAAEPVTLAEAKAHLRVEVDSEDALIGSLIVTSRLHVEASLDLAMITQSWRLLLDRWPKGDAVELPLRPLLAVDAVRVRTSGEETATLPPTSYLVDLASQPPRIVFNGYARPSPGVAANGIEIDFTAGFGNAGADVPAPLRHAILMLTAHWYEHRDPVEIGSSEARIPEAVSDLIQPFRKIRL